MYGAHLEYVHHSPSFSLASQAHDTTNPPNPERVLVVDDDVLHLKLVRALLRPDGYDLVMSSDAESALRTLEEGVPALILVDVDLPGIDGLTFTRRVRNDPRTQHVPIVVVSARHELRDRARALAAGAGLYVSKPIDTTRFPLLVSSIVRAETPTSPPGGASRITLVS
jgi:CheY-like chemotaxis protein